MQSWWHVLDHRSINMCTSAFACKLSANCIKYYRTAVKQADSTASPWKIKSGHCQISTGTKREHSSVVREQLWSKLFLLIHLWLSWPVINHLHCVNCQAQSQSCEELIHQHNTLSPSLLLLLPLLLHVRMNETALLLLHSCKWIRTSTFVNNPTWPRWLLWYPGVHTRNMLNSPSTHSQTNVRMELIIVAIVKRYDYTVFAPQGACILKYYYSIPTLKKNIYFHLFVNWQAKKPKESPSRCLLDMSKTNLFSL